jgi:hypothetical protein
MPTLADLLLALITEQPLSVVEKRGIALRILRLFRRVHEAQRLLDNARRDIRGN